MPNATSGDGTATGLELKLQTALRGIQTAIPSGKGVGLILNGSLQTQAQLVASVNQALAPFAAVRAEKTVYAAKLKAKAASEAQAREFLVQLRAALVAFFGSGSSQLPNFGFLPKKSVVRTSGQNALAAAKRQVTRDLRGTRSAKQKAGLKATGVPTVTVGSDGGLNVSPASVDVVANSPAATVASPVAPNVGSIPAVALPVVVKS